jgi:hypothetical protein
MDKCTTGKGSTKVGMGTSAEGSDENFTGLRKRDRMREGEKEGRKKMSKRRRRRRRRRKEVEALKLSSETFRTQTHLYMI